MLAEKISVSLPAEAMSFLESYRQMHAIKSRSQVIELALRSLREKELEEAYRAASNEVDPAWDATNTDGLHYETW